MPCLETRPRLVAPCRGMVCRQAGAHEKSCGRGIRRRTVADVEKRAAGAACAQMMAAWHNAPGGRTWSCLLDRSCKRAATALGRFAAGLLLVQREIRVADVSHEWLHALAAESPKHSGEE